MWRRRIWPAALALVGAAAALALPAAPRTDRLVAQAAIPQTEGWVLVVSRCVICHSVEISVQQRQGPQGWGVILDRMVSYGMPLQPHERTALIEYLVRHFGDPDGR